MISEKQVKLINKIASKETFKYTGELIQGVDQPADIDYKFRITGHKKMMSVGEYYDYLLLEVTITGANDPVSKLIFTPESTDTGKAVARMFESQLYGFYSRLNQEIMNYLRYFNDSEEEFVRTTIDDLKFDMKKPENITESRMSRLAIRTTVTDIVHILKKGEEGYFMLPDEDGGEYSFINLPFEYGVELTLEIDDEMDGYKIDGEYSYEPDDTISVIEFDIKYNPKTLKKNFYNIIGELNDIVAHELEHAFQYNRDGYVSQERPIESFKYYTQPHEIGAQRVGFRRVAKLRKLPFNDVVRDWFETHKEIHGLTDDEMEKVMEIIING
jgi:hypothetical protein